MSQALILLPKYTRVFDVHKANTSLRLSPFKVKTRKTFFFKIISNDAIITSTITIWARYILVIFMTFNQQESHFDKGSVIRIR